MIAQGIPTISYGLRGVAALELKVTGPENRFALWDLRRCGGKSPRGDGAAVLATLHDSDGHIAIPCFYDEVEALQDWERQMWSKLPVDADKLVLQESGSSALFGEKGFSTFERLWARPTAEVNGMGGGYQGQGHPKRFCQVTRSQS